MLRSFLVFIVLTCGLSAFSQTGRHVVLISIDGLCPEMYLDSCWPSPNLQRLMREGVYAPYMTSVMPAYTYPAHAAMLSGAWPAESGIAYNAPRGSKGDWHWFLKDVRVPTLWGVLKEKGLTCAAVQWPISVGAPIDWNIPEIWNPKHPGDRITETRKHATAGLIEEIEREATGRLDSANMDEEHLSMDANAARMAAYIFKTYKPNLLALHFASVDGMGHGYGRNSEPVRHALANADQGIGHVLEAIVRSGLKDSTTVIIVGDHGMSSFEMALRPNVWIKGLKARFQPAGGSCFLYADEKGHREVAAKVTERLSALPDSVKALFRVYDKDKLVKMGADRDALLALVAAPGYIFSGSDTGAESFAVKGGHHGYDPYDTEMHTGFIAAGRNIRQGRIAPLNVADIAPLLAELLGIKFESPRGRLPEGVMK